ncbi:hypothetical protein T484DRAFT_1774442 [Baffinella frigidus]|nr:hypothetical protein T484DRAFT_1774442 [Cryptophyta sp. CCMP2293]
MSFDLGPMVPRQLLDDANQGMERLKRKMDEANARNTRELEDALRTMQYQIRTLQSQARTAEEQLTRSMERERDMREALANQDISAVIGSLRDENLELTKENARLRAEAGERAASSEALRAGEKEEQRLRAYVADLEERLAQSNTESQGLAGAVFEASRLAELKVTLEVNAGKLQREIETEVRERRQIEIEKRELLAEGQQLEQLTEPDSVRERRRIEIEKRELLAEGQQLEESLAQTRGMLAAADLEARAQLEVSLAQTRGMLAAADIEARAQADRRGESDRNVTEAKRRLEERDAEALHLVKTVEAREEQLAASQHELGDARDRVRELEHAMTRKESLVAEMSEGLRRAEDEASSEAEMLASHVEESQDRISALLAELQRTEADGRSVREQMRAELRRAEGEVDVLRATLRGEADVLRATLRESREAQEALLSEQSAQLTHEMQSRSREQEDAGRREEELAKRVKALEQELRELDRAYVPETQLRAMQEEGKRSREELTARLDRLTADGQRSKDVAAATMARMEEDLAGGREREERREAKIAELEAQVYEAERVSESEQRQRVHAQEQVRALTGESHGALERGAVQPSRMAEAALEMLNRCADNAEKATDNAEKATAKVYADAAMLAGDSNGGTQQRTAVGIVLSDKIVDMTVPGSPAHALGVLQKGDEVLMVDGHKVSAATAMVMLRGDDAIGTVVTVLLRRATSGETYTVKLPRASIQVVRRRQEVAEDLAALQEHAVAALRHGNEPLLREQLAGITEAVDELDRLNHAPLL